jgi:hypothetical protein
LRYLSTTATRLLCAGIVSTGISFSASELASTRAGAAPPALGLTLQWSSHLDDAPCGAVQSSPIEFNDGGIPAVEFGDRQGDLYGFNLTSNQATGTTAPGWGTTTSSPIVGSGQGCGQTNTGGVTPLSPAAVGVEVPGAPPVDSSASVDPGSGNLHVDAGNAAAPSEGGYYAYSPNGNLVWNQIASNPPTDTLNDIGVQASASEGGGVVEAGNLGQMTYALNAGNGAPATGWPQFSADSVFSTAAVGDLYGTGSDNFIAGGASSNGFALGSHYSDGGHVRIYNDHGGLVCKADTNEEVDSSPAVGPVLPGNAYGIAVGTGTFFPGASDENTLKMYDTHCNQVWSDKLPGATGGSPALANVQGNGQLAAVEGTVNSDGTGSVWAVNAATGSLIWQAHVPHPVYGSVTTADLTNAGYQDVIVPTTQGVYILDGQAGDLVAHFDDGTGQYGVGGTYGFQNAALITADPNGMIGITLAGYFALSGTSPDVQGQVQHFEVNGSQGARLGEGGTWPQFHHDPQLTGFVGGGNPSPGCHRPNAAQSGYLTVASDGGIFAFGQDFCGSTGNIALNKPVVGMAAVPGGGGYWMVASDGGVFSFGDAQFYGSTGALHLNKPVVGMAATPDGKGYWLVASDGGIFSFGDAAFFGSAAAIPGQNIVDMAASPDGQGYWEVSTTGNIFAWGDALYMGGTGSLHLNGVIVGMAPDPVTGGYWLIGSDGGVFSFGAPFFGSTGNIHLNQPVVAMQSTGDGSGYWFVASDGGIFAYGDAPFKGSMGGQPLNRPMVGMFGF